MEPSSQPGAKYNLPFIVQSVSWFKRGLFPAVNYYRLMRYLQVLFILIYCYRKGF